ncbi:3'-5'-bisphosphate nucleotidase [Pontibacillus halophilus JSM 076056 = DSM 19796]|uniref:3'(2'),5'-bisphosphate nucleotidase CysQ n=2 Tax=Pontibacillus TaxID=289201 RepID=A0A0A5GRQ4_9BACI|nr:3'-5'-bisphosphate nucleotidase [Pontibacillus halophilus JSM 076056 = DSM 19796]
MHEVIEIAVEAGNAILEVYHAGDVEVQYKEDQSPLTIADQRSHDVIFRKLAEQTPEIPVLSEEGGELAYEQRVDWERFWLIDPLDGTKEFIKGNGEFAINIALVENGIPILGVIYAPVLDVVYFAEQGEGAYKLEGVKNKTDFSQDSISLPILSNRTKTSVVTSRSHLSQETKDYIRRLEQHVGEVELTSAGSALKMCLVAEGKADVYPRFGPTMEWDTCAGHAIMLEVGGDIIQVDSHQPLQYNKQDLLNPWFIVRREGFVGI